MSSEETIEETKSKILLKFRGYKKGKRDELKNATIRFAFKTKKGTNGILWAIPTRGTVGVAYINQFKKAMDEAKVEMGLIVSSGKYTSAAKSKSKKNGIELIPKIFPSFNIFEHKLVPKHKILGEKDREKILRKYRIQPYKLPSILASDPIITVIGAKTGDIVQITRKSPTAGEYISYRYVVDG